MPPVLYFPKGAMVPTAPRPPGPTPASWKPTEHTLSRDSLNSILGGRQKIDITEVMMKSATMGRAAELGEGWKPPGMVSREIAELLTSKQSRQSRPGSEIALKFSAALAQAPAEAPSQPSVTRSPSAPVIPKRSTDWSAMLGGKQMIQAPEPRVKYTRRYPSSSPSSVKCSWEQTTSAFNLAAKSITAGPLQNPVVAQPSSCDTAANLRGSSTLSQLMEAGVACHTFSREYQGSAKTRRDV
eukprot:TRINITY_DN61449_c0_g1_i1.p1 TRINITY_DN61449_c0_g1~~TRINITY_DN61449_c0_g1_i1.p1  ORF type:complete len:253 (+),score=49.54 TRINITY_DN61449_c0_g1_i1:37-759(+)